VGSFVVYIVQGHRALSIKPMDQFFDSKFYWKLGYSSSH